MFSPQKKRSFLLWSTLRSNIGKYDVILLSKPFSFPRFFTNPNNPLHEKLITACLLLMVTGVVLYLLRNYLKPVLSGFTRFQLVDWSIVTLLVFAIALLQFHILLCLSKDGTSLPLQFIQFQIFQQRIKEMGNAQAYTHPAIHESPTDD